MLRKLAVIFGGLVVVVSVVALAPRSDGASGNLTPGVITQFHGTDLVIRAFNTTSKPVEFDVFIDGDPFMPWTNFGSGHKTVQPGAVEELVFNCQKPSDPCVGVPLITAPKLVLGMTYFSANGTSVDVGATGFRRI